MLRKKRNKSKSNTQKESLKLSEILHKLQNLILPAVIFAAVYYDLDPLALILVLASKWRIFVVMPRHWLANLRSNATDIIVNLSTLAFMISSETINSLILWTLWYVIWLVIIKPRSDSVSVAVQAISGLILGLSALLQYNDLNEFIMLLGVWYIAISTARHFLSSYEEPFTRPLSYIWGLFVVQLAWVLYRWTLVYFIVPQIALIVGVMGYTIGSLYDQYKREETSKAIVRQHVILAGMIIAVIVFMANWSGDF